MTGSLIGKGAILALTTMLLFWSVLAAAGELTFPRTEEEIVEALSLKDGRTVYEGVDYVSEKGHVYRIIAGKRYRLRGLQDIVDSEIVPKAGALINFDFNSAKIRPVSYPMLNEFGKALEGALSDALIIVAGHTDSKGPAEYNQKLSAKRAKAVVDYLISHHEIPPHRLGIRAYGEGKPIASNDSEEGRSLNRRVEFIRGE